MTEAFEIGVSLALQDGVSEAIAKARRDVAALEHVIRESGVSLRVLRETGEKTSSVAFEPIKRAVRENTPRAETVSAPPASATLLGVPQPLQDLSSEQDMISAAAPARDRNNETITSIVEKPIPDKWSRFEDHSAGPAAVAPGQIVHAPLATAPTPGILGEPADRSEAPVVASAADKDGPLEIAPAAPTGISVAPPSQQIEDSQSAPAAPRTTHSRAHMSQGAAGHLSLINLLSLSGGSAGVGPGEAQFGTTKSALGADDDEAPDSGEAGDKIYQTAGRDIARSGFGSAPSVAESATTARPRNMSPATQMRDAGPHEGDVFLDGMLVGRWMSRFLNREAGRASAGPTGFDSRRGQLLPGVTVGG